MDERMFAIDLLRAINQRPLWARLLLRPILGKYAYHELIGLYSAFESQGYNTTYDYDLYDCSYHNDKDLDKRLWGRKNSILGGKV